MGACMRAAGPAAGVATEAGFENARGDEKVRREAARRTVMYKLRSE
jgi:hypothetical protein